MSNDIIELSETSDFNSDDNSSFYEDKNLGGFMVPDSDIDSVSDKPSHVEARAALKEEIKALIAPYEDSKKRPPFSAPEMIIMAIICGDQACYNQWAILRIILDTYRYYQRGALFSLLTAVEESGEFERDDEDKYGPETFIPGFGDAFRSHEVPLARHADSDLMSERALLQDVLWTVKPQAARIFLERRLCGRRKGTFPFFKLPAELRNTIYEMVLCFRPSQIDIGPGSSGMSCHPEDDPKYMTENTDGGDPDDEIVYADDVYLRELHFSGTKTTALLHVCKQTYSEALPILYGLNHFHFTSLSRLQAISNARDPSVARFIKHLSLYISPYGRENGSFDNVASILASIKKLKYLRLHVGDTVWFSRSRKNFQGHLVRKAKFATVDQIPGFLHLAKAAAKAEKFQLVGDCPKIRKFLDREVQKIKSKESGELVKDKKQSRKERNKVQDKK